MSNDFLPPLPEDDSLSLTGKVYLALKKGILSFAIKPRMSLIIGNIAKAYGISRTPVREALILLENEGWVKLNGVRGAVVVMPTTKTIRDVIQVKMVLESFVFKKAMEILTEEDIKAAESILDESEKAFQVGDYKSCEQIGSRFHTFLEEKTGNQVLQATIEELQSQVDRVRPLIWTKGREMIEQGTRIHRELLQAIKEKDVRKAEELVLHESLWFEEQLIPPMDILG